MGDVNINRLKEQSRLDGVAIVDVEVNDKSAADAVIEDVEIRQEAVADSTDAIIDAINAG